MPEVRGLTRQEYPFTISETTDDDTADLLVLKNKSGATVFSVDTAGNYTGRNTSAIFDVMDYGAVADGITNDAAAVQAAVNAASQYAGGGGNGGYGAIVQLPAKRMVVNSTIVLKDGVWLKGYGPATDVRGVANPVISLASSGVRPDRMMISDLTMLPTGVGIKIDWTASFTGGWQLGWPRMTLENITVNDSGSHGIWIVAGLELRMINCVTLRTGGHGIVLDGTTDSQVILCTAGEANQDGFYVSGANNKLVSCKGYGANGSGFVLAGGGRHTISACEAQDNELAGYYLTADNNALSACLSDTSNKNGFLIQSSKNVIDGIAMAGGGGTGYTTRIGFHFDSTFVSPPKGNIITATVPAGVSVPVAGDTDGNSIRVFTTGAGAKTLAYAATVTPDPYAGEILDVTLTGNITVNAPTLKHKGQRLGFNFTQDATGGRTVTFASVFRTSWTPDTAANKTNTIIFEFDGKYWQQKSVVTGLTARATIISDTFTRANGALGTAESGQTWLFGGPAGGSWVVATNKAQRTGGSEFNYSFAYIDAGTPDYTIQATMGSDLGGLLLRYQDSSNFVIKTDNRFEAWVGGTAVWSTSTAFPHVANDVIKVIASGANYIYYKNGVLQGSFGIPFLYDKTNVGLSSLHSSATFDDFTVT